MFNLCFWYRDVNISHWYTAQHFVQCAEAMGLLYELCEGQDLIISCLVSAMNEYTWSLTRERWISVSGCGHQLLCMNQTVGLWLMLCAAWLEPTVILVHYNVGDMKWGVVLRSFLFQCMHRACSIVYSLHFLSARKSALFLRQNPVAFPDLLWRAM